MKMLLPRTRRRIMLLFFLAWLLLAELAGFSNGRRMMEDKGDGSHVKASSEEQLYELPGTRGRPLVNAPSPAYEASERPVPQGSNPLHNR
uniref:Uncharacterized protein n=1 Tax=Leersia perrieri TaxID=77586 RepID=A0A0D9XL75_9ORYZ